MNRFFVPAEGWREGEVRLSGEQAHQIREVLRLRAGATIVALDHSGGAFRVELTQVTGDAVRGRIGERIMTTPEPRTELVLYQSLLKAAKFEWVLQKCTELGVAEFAPVLSGRSVPDAVGRTKWSRWERILTEAAEQSSRSKVPRLRPIQGLEEALREAQARGGLALIPWEQEREVDLRSVLDRGSAGARIHLFIGPEGGFSADEINRARTCGAHPVTLGPRTLRAETAGLVAASAIFFARGELDARPVPAGNG